MTIACVHPPIYLFQPDSSLMGSGSALRSQTRGDDPANDWVSAADPQPSEAAVDRWLNDKLQMLYGPVLSEPIPEQLAQLIAEHRKQKHR